MLASQKAKDLNKKFEGLGPNVFGDRIYPYICPAGKLTVLYGHVIEDHEMFRYFNIMKAQKDLNIKSFNVAAAIRLYNRDRAKFLSVCIPQTKADAERVHDADIAETQQALNSRLAKWKVSVSQSVFDALICFGHNNGPGGWDGTIKTRLINGDLDGAILWLPMFTMADDPKTGKKASISLYGLTLRRFSEVWLALKNEVWRIGSDPKTRALEVQKFLAEVRSLMKQRGKSCPLPYPRNLEANSH